MAQAEELDEGLPVTLTCVPGSIFSDNAEVKHAHCIQNSWNTTEVICKGKFNLTQYHKVIIRPKVRLRLHAFLK